MAKGAKAPCPVCGQEINDPDFRSNRTKGFVVKCANCKSTLEWVQPVWERWHLPWATIIAVPDLIRVFVGKPLRQTPLGHFYYFSLDITLILCVLALAGLLSEKIGLIPRRLKAADHGYSDPHTSATRLREERSQVANLPKLQINPRTVLPPSLRPKSILSLTGDTAIDRATHR